MKNKNHFYSLRNKITTIVIIGKYNNFKIQKYRKLE